MAQRANKKTMVSTSNNSVNRGTPSCTRKKIVAAAAAAASSRQQQQQQQHRTAIIGATYRPRPSSPKHANAARKGKTTCRPSTIRHRQALQANGVEAGFNNPKISRMMS